MNVGHNTSVPTADDDQDIDVPCAGIFKVFEVTLLLFAIAGVVVNAFLLYICVEFFGVGKCYQGVPTRTSRRRGSILTIPRPQYPLNCYVFNGALAAILASTIQTIRGIGNTFFDSDIFYVSKSNDTDGPEVNPVLQDLSAALIFMSTLFGPFAVAHFNFLFLLNVDKLYYILKPLHYDQIMNRKGRAVLACLIMWSFSFTWVPMMVAFRDQKHHMLEVETILIGVLHLVPTAFGLISAIIVAVTAHRIIMRDRKDLRVVEDNGNEAVRTQVPTSSTWRSFRGIAWTTIFSLPHPSVRTVLYCYARDTNEYVAVMEDCSVATMSLIVVNFSVAYLVGIPVIVICTHRAYRYRARELLRWLLRCEQGEDV